MAGAAGVSSLMSLIRDSVVRTVHATVVGNGQAVHAELFGVIHERFEFAEAVQQAEFGVNM